jgi:hypothetical protein
MSARTTWSSSGASVRDDDRSMTTAPPASTTCVWTTTARAVCEALATRVRTSTSADAALTSSCSIQTPDEANSRGAT